MDILVDSNVILDVVTQDPTWFAWSTGILAEYASDHILSINPIIYAEVSIGFDRIEDLEDVLSPSFFRLLPLPWEAAFLASKCFLTYRRQGGSRTSPLPDFYIGGHATVRNMTLITRDANRYRTYFPALKIVAPPRL
ncbi:MAG: type II toxin-antitoxin system VapC family toxin [Syntrophales bacterium]